MINKINEQLKNTMPLASAIGMTITAVDPATGKCTAEMPVDERNKQPYGYLSGGAILAMAETLAGIASLSIDQSVIPVGMNINANHIHSAAVGDVVTATSLPIHLGTKTHVWQIEVKNKAEELISIVSVTNFIIHKK